MGVLDIVTDPSLPCIATIAAIGYYFNVTEETRIEFFTNKYFLGIVGLTLGVSLLSNFLSKSYGVKLSFAEKKLAQWYLMSGVFIHILVDGLHLINAIPLVHDIHALVDNRFKGDALVSLLSGFELSVVGPLCLIQSIAISTRSSYRHALQILVCTLQLVGTVFYTASEYMNGGMNVRFDSEYTFAPDFIVFFWAPLAILVLLYFILPVGLIIASIRSIGLIYSVTDKNLVPKSNKAFMISNSVFEENPASPARFGSPALILSANITSPIKPKDITSDFEEVANPANFETIRTTTTTTTTTTVESVDDQPLVETTETVVETTETVPPAEPIEAVVAPVVEEVPAPEPVVVEKPAKKTVEKAALEVPPATEQRARRRSARLQAAAQ